MCKQNRELLAKSFYNYILFSLIAIKNLEKRYTHMNLSIFDIFWLSEAFWGARIGNFDIKPTDGATIFVYLMTGETSGMGTEHECCNPLLDMPTKLISRNAEQLNNIPTY